MRLAEAVPAVDLISVDSVMVYKGLDVGTAKPSAEMLSRWPHALINIRDPADPYSVADFLADAKKEVAASRAVNRIPVLVGGSMLYCKALRDGLSPLPPAHAETRTKIEAYANQHGWPAVHAKLLNLDPKTAGRLSPNDSQRLQRAMEVYMVTGRTLSDWWSETPLPGLETPMLSFVLAPKERKVLHTRIASRFRTMLAQGLIEEARKLYERADLHDGLPALRAVGYRQVCACIKGDIQWSQLEEKAVAATRQMAKRQLTWLRRWDELIWFPESVDDALAVVLRHLDV